MTGYSQASGHPDKVRAGRNGWRSEKIVVLNGHKDKNLRTGESKLNTELYAGQEKIII